MIASLALVVGVEEEEKSRQEQRTDERVKCLRV